MFVTSWTNFPITTLFKITQGSPFEAHYNFLQRVNNVQACKTYTSRSLKSYDSSFFLRPGVEANNSSIRRRWFRSNRRIVCNQQFLSPFARFFQFIFILCLRLPFFVKTFSLFLFLLAFSSSSTSLRAINARSRENGEEMLLTKRIQIPKREKTRTAVIAPRILSCSWKPGERTIFLQFMV